MPKSANAHTTASQHDKHTRQPQANQTHTQHTTANQANKSTHDNTEQKHTHQHAKQTTQQAEKIKAYKTAPNI